MKTALLITNAADTRRQLEQIMAGRASAIVVPAPAEPTPEHFTALFTTWLRLVDLVILDGVALSETVRWAIETLAETATNQPVILRCTAQQRQLFPVPRAWHIVDANEPHDQVAQSLTTFLDLCEARTHLRRADTPTGPRPLPAATAVTGFDSYRYRDALKTLSRLLGQNLTERELIGEFLRLVRDLIGAGKLAIFTRSVSGDQLTVAGSVGVGGAVVEHLRLTLDGGIGQWLSREVRILRRGQTGAADERIERELELLGTEVVVPMFDNDQLLGVLTFSGRITGEPLTNEELELVYQLLTQLAQALQNLRLADRVAGQQRLFSEVLANIHSGVLVVGQDEKIVAFNDSARRLLELSEDSLVGQPLTRIPGRVADIVFAALQGAPPAGDQEIVLPRVNRPLRVRVTRFEQAETGQPVVVALIEDLTQERLEQSHARELADREFLMRLAFRLSHELKNSLVSIKIFAQLLPERYNEKEFRDQFSSVVINEVNRVDVLVNNLTFFSHPLALVHDDLVLSDVLESCVKNVGQEFGRKQIAVVLNVGEKAPEGTTLPVVLVKKNFAHKLARLNGDKLRLMQAFEHVFRNALQALPAGGRLALSTEDALLADFPDGKIPAGGAIKITWQDSGEGIALENLPHVAEPFFTMRNVGVGLGLTIVKKIVERHSGRLEVDSLLGRGTTVTMVLPVAAQPHPEDALLAEITQRATATDETGESPAATNRLPKSARRG